MALPDLRSGEERPRRRGDLALAPVAAEGVDLGKERLGRPHDRIGREGADRDGALGRPPGVEEGRERAGGGELRSVEEGESFLRSQDERRHPGRLERGPAGQAAPFERRGSLPDHHRREMRERSEVARGADRPLDRYVRQDAALEHPLDGGDELRPDPGCAAAEAEDLERHHQPDVRVRETVPQPDAMRPDEVALQGLDLAGRDADPGELPEPRVHAVDGPVAPRALAKALGRCGDRRPAVGMDARRRSPAIDALELGEARLAGTKRLGHGVDTSRPVAFMVPFRPPVGANCTHKSRRPERAVATVPPTRDRAPDAGAALTRDRPRAPSYRPRDSRRAARCSRERSKSPGSRPGRRVRDATRWVIAKRSR